MKLSHRLPGAISGKSPPLTLVIFWNVFTAIHAGVMLRGLWGSPFIVFLLMFYAVFFALGIWMARAWWTARSLRSDFGSPQLQPMPEVLAGQNVKLVVQFDKAFAVTEHFDATLQWIGRGPAGDPATIREPSAAQGITQGCLMAGTTGMIWEAWVTVPSPPATVSAFSRHELLLTLHPAASASPCWCFSVPFKYEQKTAINLMPEQVRQIQKVLSVIAGVMLLAGAGFLFSVLRNEHFSFLRLMFPCAIFFGVNFVWKARRFVAQQSSINEAGRPGALGAAIFFARPGRYLRGFVFFAFMAFILDVFFPDSARIVLDMARMREIWVFFSGHGP